MEGLENRLSTYKQYKEDTESIAGWLAQNALRCGYRVADVSPPSARLKGKARKEARAAAKTKSQAQYTINVSDFTLMAGAIAGFKPAIKIPAALDNLFSRAIEARKEFSEWYSQHASHESGSNQRHSHFTNVLTNTWEILRPFERARASRAARHPPMSADEPSVRLANRFDGLHVESPSSEHIPATDAAAQPEESSYELKDVVPVAITKSEDDIEADFFFAIHSFLVDVHDLREAIRSQYWPRYHVEGGIELILLALVTNTAIQLVRRGEHQLDLLIERPKKYPFPAHNFPAIMMHAMHPEIANTIEDLVKPSNMVCFVPCDHAELLFWDIYQALQLTVWQTKHCGNNDQMMQLESQDEVSESPEAFKRMRDLLPCFTTIANTMSQSFASDEITSAIGHIVKTKTVPIWTLFAFQVLLDVQDVLEEKGGLDLPLKEVKWHTQKMSKTFNSLELKAKTYDLPPKDLTWMAGVIKAYELDVLEDNFRKTGILGSIKIVGDKGKMTRIRSIEDFPAGYDVPTFMKEPDYYLRQNPIKCGMLQYGIYLQTHNFGYNIEYRWRGITAMVHLYVACRSLYPDDPVWPDMEYFLQYQDINKIFSGGLPKSMEEAMSKTLLSMGLKPSSFARDRQKAKGRSDVVPAVRRGALARLKNADLNLNNGRYVTNPCVLDAIFLGWMSGGEHISDDRIVELVNALSDPKTMAEKARQAGHDAETLKDLEITTADRQNPSRLMQSLLRRLTYVVCLEMGSLQFNCMSFAKTCRMLWDRIISETDAFYETGPGCIYSSLMCMLDEAQHMECLAKDINAPDVSSFVRDNAFGLPRSWAMIQDLNTTVVGELHIPRGPDGPASGLICKKTWASDRELNKPLLSALLFKSSYPLSSSAKYKLYNRWPVKHFIEGSFEYVQRARETLWERDRKERAQAIAEAKVELEGMEGCVHCQLDAERLMSE